MVKLASPLEELFFFLDDDILLEQFFKIDDVFEYCSVLQRLRLSKWVTVYTTCSPVCLPDHIQCQSVEEEDLEHLSQ